MEAPLRSPAAEDAALHRRGARRRAFVAVALLVLALHAALLGGVDPGLFGPSDGRRESGERNEPMRVRTLERLVAEAPALAPTVPAEPAPAAAPARVSPRAATPRAAVPVHRPRPQPAEAPPPVVASAGLVASPPLAAVASGPTVAGEDTARAAAEAASASSATAFDERHDSPAEGASASTTAAASAMASAGLAASPPAGLLAEGESPPPVYPTVLPPSTALRYEVRRGFLRGRGAIRWQRIGDDYGLRLEATIAGVLLLAQTSQGIVDAAGLAPVRFLDQRARRSPQAANFRREAQTITFSGPSTVWPLLPGTQDSLSWMIQLAGIVAADPQRAVEGGPISMVIVGARGDAGVRRLRFAGREPAETAQASVTALKFVVDARSAYDSAYEIWLDPERFYLPVHATRRNAAGVADFDLLLEDLEPIS